MSELIKSKKFIITSVVAGIFIIALFSFAMGIFVGVHKGKFSCRFGENYERNFAGPHSEMSGPMKKINDRFEKLEGREFRNAHGLSGIIISTSDNKLIIKDKSEKENTVTISEKTIIKFGRDTIGVQDLKSDMQIIVMGRPGEDGTINADLIRVFGGSENK